GWFITKPGCGPESGGCAASMVTEKSREMGGRAKPEPVAYGSGRFLSSHDRCHRRLEPQHIEEDIGCHAGGRPEQTEKVRARKTDGGGESVHIGNGTRILAYHFYRAADAPIHATAGGCLS